MEYNRGDTNVTPLCLRGDTNATPMCLQSDTNVTPMYLQGDTNVTPSNPGAESSQAKAYTIDGLATEVRGFIYINYMRYAGAPKLSLYVRL
jgi:hypothetical protein